MKFLAASAKKIELIDEKATPLIVLPTLGLALTTEDWTYLAVYLVLVIVGAAAHTSETTERSTIATSTKEAAPSDRGTRAAIGVGGSTRLGVLGELMQAVVRRSPTSCIKPNERD